MGKTDSDVAASRQQFKKLFEYDVSEKSDKKGQFTYLSWTDAWQIINEQCDDIDYEIHDDIVYPDSTVEVRVTVTIDGRSRMMWLPVKNHLQKAIENPDARQISDARMRCLVKCLAMFGLGLYIYQGEDVPSVKSGYEDYKADLEKDPHAFALMFMQADEETKSEITASALPFKKKTEWAKQILEGQSELHKWADGWAQELMDMLLPEDGQPKLDSIKEAMTEFEPYERWLVMQRFEESDKETFRKLYMETLNNE